MDFILSCLSRLQQESALSLRLLGIGPPGQFFARAGLNIECRDTIDYPGFKALLSEQHNAIGIIPLDDSPFSGCKSAIKYVDYSLAGIPTICSNVPPYADVVEGGINGLLCVNEENAWVSAIKDLATSVARRVVIANNARGFCERHFSMEVAARSWQQVLATQIQHDTACNLHVIQHVDEESQNSPPPDSVTVTRSNGSREVGFIDVVDRSLVKGWAVGRNNEGKANVQLIVDGIPLQEMESTLFRKDLYDADIFGGRAAFEFKIPKNFLDGEQHVVNVVNLTQGVPISDRGISVSLDKSRYNNIDSIIVSVVFAAGNPDYFSQRIRQAKKVALIASFTRSGRFLAYHRRLFLQLNRLGFVTVSCHSDGETPLYCQDIKDYGLDALIRKKNVGYDFGSWATGIAVIEPYQKYIEEIILINDSNFGVPSQATFAHTTGKKSSQFYAMTDSYEMIYHAQSYCMGFGRDAIQNGDLFAFFGEYEFFENKEEVIRHGELSLTRFFLQRGYDLKIFAPYEEVANRWLNDLPKTISMIRECYDSFSPQSNKLVEVRVERLREAAELIMANIPVNPTHLFFANTDSGVSVSLSQARVNPRKPNEYRRSVSCEKCYWASQ